MSLPFLPPLALIAVVLAASPAFADAVTYQGTLGKSAILLELSSPPPAPKLAGRYSYLSQGIDIPLDAALTSPGKIELVEEQPCTDKTCHISDDGDPDGPAPLGAAWHLTANADGSALSGTWTDGGKSLPLSLTRYGARKLPSDFDGTPSALESINDSFVAGEQELTKTVSPYDFLKMQVPVKDGAATRWGDVAFKYVTDPRTKFQFPRITDLGGASITAANAYLARHHWEMSTSALNCAATRYQGLGWSPSLFQAAGTLAGYDDESVDVSYLSPTVMSWIESGSLDCGGAHPNNHRDLYSIDVKTGQPLDMSLLFKGWVPTPAADDTLPKTRAAALAHPDDYRWGPDKTLLDFVMAHRQKNADPDLDSDCGNRDIVESNLKISFANGEKVRFSLDELPNVIAVCNDDLFELPIAAVGGLLTPAAADYFPSLRAR
jgi:hypothetical protein